MSEQPQRTLEDAVKDFLNRMYWDEHWGERPSWPGELERMVGWTEPEEPDANDQWHFRTDDE